MRARRQAEEREQANTRQAARQSHDEDDEVIGVPIPPMPAAVRHGSGCEHCVKRQKPACASEGKDEENQAQVAKHHGVVLPHHEERVPMIEVAKVGGAN